MNFQNVAKLETSENTETGTYFIEAAVHYTADPSIKAVNINKVKIGRSLASREFFGIEAYILFIGILVLFLLAAAGYWGRKEYKAHKTYMVAKVRKLPRRGLFIGNVAQTKKKTYLATNQLTTHVVVSGSSGSGKTVAAQDIIEEALLKGISVMIFDPTAQWTGFLRKCQDKAMLKLYPKFGMKRKDAKGFKGTLDFISNPHEIVDIKEMIEQKGQAHIFVVNKLSNDGLDQLVASTIQQVYDSQLPETRKLKLMLVYDEVHRLVPKYGGSGKGIIQIERAVREFRKWGVGLMLISQILGDFVEEVHANITTEVQMRTKHKQDLTRIQEKYGKNIFRLLNSAKTGTGMVQNAEYNEGRPYFVAFRPIRHNTTKLTEKQLTIYEKHQSRVDTVDYQFKQLKELNEDIFDLVIELNLAKDKLAEGKFKLAKIYLDGLEPKLKEFWRNIGKKPKVKKKQYLNKAYLTKQISEVKKKRKVIIQKEKKTKQKEEKPKSTKATKNKKELKKRKKR